MFEILILSWDGYSFLWKPFFLEFYKYFPEAKKHNVRLVTGGIKNFNFNNVIHHKLGSDFGPMMNLKKSLSFVESDYVLVFVDDFFLHKKVSYESLIKTYNFLKNEKYDFCNFVRMNFEILPLLSKAKIFDQLYSVKSSIPYCTSLGVGMWKSKSLFKIIDDDENAWDFERKSFMRASSLNFKIATSHNGFLKSSIFNVINVIERKYINRNSIILNSFAEIKLNSGFKLRPIYSSTIQLSYELIRYFIFLLIIIIFREKGKYFLSKIIEKRKLKFQN